VKPAPFDYYAPRTLDEALRILAEAGGEGRVLAGGQSLGPMLNFRLAKPAVVVDINRVEGLDTLETTPQDLRVGARVRHAAFLRSQDVRQGWPLLAEATRHVAHMAIRNRGTVCGSICHNDPAAEQPSLLVTLGGTVEIASAKGRRELPADEFLTGMMSNALEPGEIVVAVRYPRPAPGTSVGFDEFARRLGDFAIAGAATTLTVKDGRCTAARLTIIGMGKGPFRAREAEASLVGAPLAGKDGEAALAAAVARTVATVEPAGDVHASAGYRRHLAGVMAERALGSARTRAMGG
jgi:CO/xanthine dehydrogenase FAD-binding subunit